MQAILLCPSASSALPRMRAAMSEETDNTIRIKVESGHEDHDLKTITISSEKGITALYCVDHKIKTTYIFDKDKGWTMESAQEWVDEHEDKMNQPLLTKLNKAVEGQIRFKGYKMKALSRDPDTGDLLVPGIFTDDKQDEVGDIITKDATKDATTRWRMWGNIRTMHDFPSGRVKSIGEEDGLKWNEIITIPVDEQTKKLLEGGVLQAYSVGIIPKEWEINEDALPEDEEDIDIWMWLFPPIIIYNYDMVEISYVDIPANPRAVITDVQMQMEAAMAARTKLAAPQGPRHVIFKVLSGSPFLSEDEQNAARAEFEALSSTEKLDLYYKYLDGELDLTDPKVLAKAEWTTAAINDAKDLIFAAVEPTGEKDDEGKTEPRNARHLPHHNLDATSHSDANVDLPHYRNALARVNQIKPVTDTISQDSLRSKASSHLDGHSSVLETEDGLDAEMLLDHEIWERFTSKHEPTLENWLEFQEQEKKMDADITAQTPDPLKDADITGDNVESVVPEEVDVSEKDADMLAEIHKGLTSLSEKMDTILESLNEGFELMLSRSETPEPIEDPDVSAKELEAKEQSNEGQVTQEVVVKMIDDALSTKVTEMLKETENQVVELVGEKLAELSRPQDRKALLEQSPDGDEEGEKDAASMTRNERRARMRQILDEAVPVRRR